ncbi:MAG: hypothetical protein DYH16_09605 [Nitrosomonas sp. PRO5]|nr:hypothetical protein [Nitrosomonas sp. PRO5]
MAHFYPAMFDDFVKIYAGGARGAVESIHVSYRWRETIEFPNRRNAAGETHHDVKKTGWANCCQSDDADQ